MSSTYGENLRLSIFGQSHGPAIGMSLDGIPAGLPVNVEVLQQFLDRRAPGQYETASKRFEPDLVEFLSGIVDGNTCGAPIAAIIRNIDAKPADYDPTQDLPRPGHADFTAAVKYGAYRDVSGGGHFSGRLTAPLCIAGGLCLQWLDQIGIHIRAHIQQIHDIPDTAFDPVAPQFNLIQDSFPVISGDSGENMRCAIMAAKERGDSLGGIIECAIIGIPAGIGEPMFGGMESKLSHILYGIPAIKGVEFGRGFACAKLTGSENNDAFSVAENRIVTQTNRCGGILGGITTGMPIIFRVAVKPTPSISLPQQTVSLEKLTQQTVSFGGRHDPCIVPRAVPAVEAAAAIAIFDALLARKDNYGTNRITHTNQQD